MVNPKKQAKIPVILYESEDQVLPYIEVGQEDEMPTALFIQEYKHTGEYEPDSNGKERPIVDMLVHMFVNMSTLSEKLPLDLYDQVRVAIGLQPVEKARQDGQKIMDKVISNVNNQMEEAYTNKQHVKDELGRRLNEKLTEKFFKMEEVTKTTEKTEKE